MSIEFNEAVLNSNGILVPRYFNSKGHIYYDAKPHYDCDINKFVIFVLLQLSYGNLNVLEKLYSYYLKLNEKNLIKDNSLEQAKFCILVKTIWLIRSCKNIPAMIKELWKIVQRTNLSISQYVCEQDSKDVGNVASDLLVRFFDFDKIELTGKYREKTIITARREINEIFYNYMLFDFKVEQQVPIFFIKESQELVQQRFDPSFHDDEIGEELSSIKRLCKSYDERKKFIK